MSNACLSPTDPNVARINQGISKVMGLPTGLKVKGQDLVEAIRGFMAEQNIPQNQLKFYMRGTSPQAKQFMDGLTKYLSEYFGLGAEIMIEDAETLSVIGDILKENSKYFNQAIDDTQEARDLANTLSMLSAAGLIS